MKLSVCLSIVAAVLAVVCGSASARPGAGGTFVVHANAACRDYYRAVTALPRATDLPTLATFMSRAHPLAVRFVRRVRALEPPARQAAVYRTFVASISASTALDPAIVVAAKRGDSGRVRTLVAREQALDRTMGVAAMTLRLTTCATPPRA